MQKKRFFGYSHKQTYFNGLYSLHFLKADKLGCYSITNEILNRFSTEASPFHGCQYFN